MAGMQQMVDDPNLSYIDRVYFCFSLGKAYEDRQNYQTSFEYYSRGNHLKKLQSRYRAEQMTDEFKQQIAACQESLFEGRKELGHPASDPIFVVGLPRAGSTLLEQILSSHSMIDGTLELPNITRMVLAEVARRINEGHSPEDDGPFVHFKHGKPVIDRV